VGCLYLDRRGDLWVGTWGGGLNRTTPPRDLPAVRPRPGQVGPPARDVRAVIFEDQRGNLWVGTQDGGLNLLTDRERGTFRHYGPQPGNPAAWATTG
jgi:ligand-binding sensor domain-containing protein